MLIATSRTIPVFLSNGLVLEGEVVKTPVHDNDQRLSFNFACVWH